MKILVCLLCAAAALLQAPSASAFCLLPQPRLVCAEYFASQFVVEATLLQTEVLHDKNDPEGISARLYTLRVDGVLRGKVVGRIRIYEGNDSGRAPFEWNRGTKYLLFLFYLPGQKSWSLDGCGNSRPLSEAKATFSEIELIRAAHGGGVQQRGTFLAFFGDERDFYVAQSSGLLELRG